MFFSIETVAPPFPAENGVPGTECQAGEFRARNFGRTPLIHAQVQGFVRHFGQADRHSQQWFLRNFEIEQQPRREQRRTADAEFLSDDSGFAGRSGELETFPDRRETFEEERLFFRNLFRAVEKGGNPVEIIGIVEVVENFRGKVVEEAVEFRFRVPGEVLPDQEFSAGQSGLPRSTAAKVVRRSAAESHRIPPSSVNERGSAAANRFRKAGSICSGRIAARR